MWYCTVGIIAIGINSVFSYNSTYDKVEVIYPDKIQDEFPTKCFPDVGCFYTGPPWYHPLYRPVSVVPQNNITIRYLLYTKRNPQEYFNFHPKEASLKHSNYRRGKKVTVLVHGYEKNYHALLPIKNELLAYQDRNVFVIDWERAANVAGYQVAANARVVGAKIANMLQFLMTHADLKPGDIYLIGRSVGGQLIAYVGQRIEHLGRITALDPAGIYFHHLDKEVRLDKDDAVFVDSIRTNVGDNIYNGEGYKGPIGHADFYPNGGHHQPGCDRKHFFNFNVKGKKVANQCSHDASQRYFVSSIRKCVYNSTACFSYRGYKDGHCKHGQTNRMGFFAKKPHRYQWKYYVDTKKSPPYCEVNKIKTVKI